MTKDPFYFYLLLRPLKAKCFANWDLGLFFFFFLVRPRSLVIMVVLLWVDLEVRVVLTYSSVFFLCSLPDKEAVRLGEKRWQDVGIAVCVHRPAMPPYCHFLLLYAANVPMDFFFFFCSLCFKRRSSLDIRDLHLHSYSITLYRESAFPWLRSLFSPIDVLPFQNGTYRNSDFKYVPQPLRMFKVSPYVLWIFYFFLIERYLVL